MKRMKIGLLFCVVVGLGQKSLGQSTDTPKQPPAGFRGNPAETEVWEPTPILVKPGKVIGAPPSDAIILFDGTSSNEWVTSRDKSPINWTIEDGTLVVNKSVPRNNIETQRSFTNYQLHIEWMVPAEIKGEGQGRGNSGLFLASTGLGDAGYEIQILDSYNNENKTYINGAAGSIYKQQIPLVNPAAKAGEWNTYDIAWTAPTFLEDGSLKSPARVTTFFNGVLIHNQVDLKGETVFVGQPKYRPYKSAPIKLQAHGDPSESIRFRNIWIREN
jgi:hypothetical protein